MVIASHPWFAGIMLALAPVLAHAPLPADPLGSPMWQRLGTTLFGG
ncbi:quinoprotein dehydrogenase-associated SoxYZ-like carrier, partial [Pseudomonas sp. FW215-R3]